MAILPTMKFVKNKTEIREILTRNATRILVPESHNKKHAKVRITAGNSIRQKFYTKTNKCSLYQQLIFSEPNEKSNDIYNTANIRNRDK